MVPPNGVSRARSGSTWIHWWSSVASANASTRSWVTSCQSLTPSSSPILDFSSSGPVIVSMPGSLSPVARAPSGERELLLAARLDDPLGVVSGSQELLGRDPVAGEDRDADRG